MLSSTSERHAPLVTAKRGSTAGKLICRILFVPALLVGLAACTGHAGSDDAPLAQPSISRSVTASPTGPPLTRDQAAQRYLQLVALVNSPDVFGGTCRRDFNNIVEDKPDTTAGARFTNARRCTARLSIGKVDFAAALRQVAWPDEARADVERLARWSDIEAQAWDALSKARTETEFKEAWKLRPNDAADRVRARLGLPERSTS